MSSWIRTTDLCRYYKRVRHEVRAVDRVTLSIEKGEFVGVVGSRDGPATLSNQRSCLHFISCIHILLGTSSGFFPYQKYRPDSQAEMARICPSIGCQPLS